MSIEDIKAEVKKQELHDYLSQSLIKKTKLTDLANEALNNLNNNYPNMNETTNLTSSGIVTKSLGMRASQSYKILPGVSPITKDFESLDNSVLIKMEKNATNDYGLQRSPNNRYNGMMKLKKPSHH